MRIGSLVLIAGLAMPAVGAGQPVAVGQEFVVNAYTMDNQITPAVAMDIAGGFVVAWERADGSDLGISGRRFDSFGSPLGSDFQVDSFPSGSQSNPSIARNPTGSFVVVWGSYLQDGDGDGVFGQRFDAAGVAQGGEFRVATRTMHHQSYPDISMASDGSFVVVWESYLQDGHRWGIFGQRFDNAANPQGLEFQVNVFTTEEQRKPRVAIAGDTSFTVVWNSEQDGDATGVFARRFDSSGSAVADEFQVNTLTFSSQLLASVSRAPAGGFLIVWQSFGQDKSGWGIFGRRFDAQNSALGVEFQINGNTTEDQRQPTVLHTPNGDFVVAWQSDHARQNGYDVITRAFNALAQPRGWEVAVNTNPVGNHTLPRMAGMGGRFVVAWQSFDGDGSGVLGRRFYLPLTLDVDGDGEVQPLTDALLVLRYSFGFRGATLIAGAVDADCTRCDALSIEVFLSVM